jgi:hypothetical protein
MTVGIAAICDNGKAIVMAADKLMTVGEANLATDGTICKLMPLSPRVWTAITGSIQESEYAQERFRHSSLCWRPNRFIKSQGVCEKRASICGRDKLRKGFAADLEHRLQGI